MQLQQLPFKRLVLATALVSIGSAAQAEELVLEEVTVTAQKRAEPLQETPIAISAFSSDSLEKLGISDMTDLRGNVPSLSVAPFAATRAAPVVFIRGMGNIDVQSTRDGAVGVYVDGVSLGRASGLATEIADLERVEVLRGPQGTLYGRNTTGGAINFITQKPTDEFEFKQQITAGNYNLLKSVTSVNGGLTEKISAKATYQITQRDGWVENTSTQANQIDFNEDDSKAGNFALRALVTDSVTIDYSYDFSSLDYGNGYYQKVRIAPGMEAYNPAPYDGDSDRQDKTDLYAISPSETEVKGHNITVAWELENVTLKSITAHRELDDSLFQNYNNLFIQTNQQEQWQLSQEFQAIGNVGSSIEYVTGLYYFNEHSEEWQNSDVMVAAATYAPDTWATDADSKSYAVYGQGSWTPAANENLRLTLGLRYTKDEREATKIFINDLTTISPPGTSITGKEDFSKVNPTFTIDYAINDNINTYAKVATGYRAGGFGTRSTAAAFSNGFDEENVTSFELGIKSDIYEKRVRLNAALFANKYEDLQISQKRNPEIFTDIINAGEASINGLELEVTALISEGLTADFYYSYLDAEYDEYLDTVYADENDFVGTVTDLADEKKVPYSPKGAAKIGLEYALTPVSYGQYIFNIDFQWQDDTYSGPDKESLNDSYSIVNGRAQLANIAMPQGDLRVALWGKNLTDEEYTTITTNFSSAGFTAAMFGTPRTFGVDAIYEF